MIAREKTLKIVLPLLILAVGIAGAVLMVKSRQAPQKVKPVSEGALVRTTPVEVVDHPVRVIATGTVQPHQQAEIVPQVSGTVSEISPRLLAGEFFRRGELLFKVEAIDYRLAVDQAEASLARAELELATEQSRARVARQEWEQLRGEDDARPNPLVVYEPQLKEAKANVRSARASLEQARLNLKRTQIRAPFDARVASENIDLGQYVRPGTTAAVLTGTAKAEVLVPLPLEELAYLDIPGRGEGGSGSEATVRLELNGRTFEWSGRIVRSLGEIDPRGRMARVVVAVDDPYQRQSTRADRPDLSMGLFVDLVLHGSTLHDVIPIPRAALRENSTVWVAGADDRLEIRPVEVVRRERDRLFIGKGLEEDERIVLTNIPGAAQGMKLRPATAQGPKP